MGDATPFSNAARRPAGAQDLLRLEGPSTAATVVRSSRKSLRHHRQEREFLPAALELIESPVSPTLRITSLAICGLCTVAIGWACLSRIDMVAVAPGKVVPLGQVKVVQPLETSVIRAIHVDEGDHVAQGALLVELDPTDAKADLDQLLYDRGQAALDAEVARLLLLQDPKAEFRTPEGVDPELSEANHRRAVSQIAKVQAEIAELDHEIEQRDASLEANSAQIIRARETLPLLNEKQAAAQTLWDQRAGTRPVVLDSRQQTIEKQAELDGAKAETKRLGAEARSFAARRDEAEATFLADASDQRTKALQKLSDLDQQIAKARQREGFRRLVAPASGTVQGVKIHTPGAVVTSADTLMTLVPDDAGIEIEALVENKDIGFVREGQEVAIKLDAFPFTRYGLLSGVVRRLGRDAATPQQVAGVFGSAQPEGGTSGNSAASAGSTSTLAYPARIGLDQDWILVDGKRQLIRSGMHVSAEVKTGDRRAIDYILSPVTQAVQEAGREK